MSGEGCSVPVGSVLAYAGQLNNNQLNNLGWSICDGARLDISQYPDLFKAIGTANGGDGNTYFNLPDYQGYFLRGVDPTGSVDKEASSRGAATSGGASGPNVGSVESFYTAAPNNSFYAYVPHIPTDDHDAYTGSNDDMLQPGSSATFYSSGGGDDETRPINAYVNFIIKLTPLAPLPTGLVVPFAGNSASGTINLLLNYRFCDGTLLPQTVYNVLFSAIGIAHGGNSTGFNLPDYRGRFLRGVDNGTGRDPNSASRSRMAPGAAIGDAVGSIQGFGTGLPKNPFSITFNLGNQDKDSDKCAGHQNSKWNSGSVSVSFTGMGGDAETRPVNINVDHYILFQTDQNDTDIFPIGGIIGLPGDQPPPTDQWMLCDGSSVSNSEFADLFYAIQYDNGGDGQSNFNLPNYKGYFLRGTDRGQNRDPNASGRTAAQSGGQTGDQVGSAEGFATARPVMTDITGQVSHLPSEEGNNAAAVCVSSVAEWDGPQSIQVQGGDAETCPINANIHFYIKYAPSP